MRLELELHLLIVVPFADLTKSGHVILRHLPFLPPHMMTTFLKPKVYTTGVA